VGIPFLIEARDTKGFLMAILARKDAWIGGPERDGSVFVTDRIDGQLTAVKSGIECPVRPLTTLI
jgi:hypothetical protein